jgi:hypothetical protein
MLVADLARLRGAAEFAAVAAALDPITSAIVLDAQLVRPPSGVPVRVLPEHSARLVGVGIDDLGPKCRTVKIALVYGDPAHARADGRLIEHELPTTALAGTRGEHFADLAAEWRVAANDRAVVISARLPSRRQPRRVAPARGARGPRRPRQARRLSCSRRCARCRHNEGGLLAARWW